jgi:two-component system, NarL family, response regulator NreC
MPERIRVLIADDHPLFRDGLRHLLHAQADIDMIGEATNGLEAVEMARALRPDVLLVDIAMPSMSGLEVVPLVRDSVPQTQIVILSMFAKEAYTHQVLTDGARAYVLKGAPSTEVLAAIRAVHAGRYYFSEQVHAEVITSYKSKDRPPSSRSISYNSLTDRERQVFLLLVEGHPSQRISDLLAISIKTVEKHRASISRKLGISHPVDMVKFAIRYGIIDPDFWKT